jgi:hypothetical protein
VHPHKEVPFGALAELLVVDDVAAVLQQEAGDGVDDARRLAAVQGQDMLNGGRPEVAGRIQSE